MGVDRSAWASAALVAVALLAGGCTLLREMPIATRVQKQPEPTASAAATMPAETSSAAQQQETPPASTPGAPATSAMHKPGFDSPERKAILDALRPAVENALKQKVVFKVNHLRAMDGFAFLQAQPLRPNEQPIDYSKTQYAEAYASGAFDDRVDALLRWNGERWRVVKWVLGATDVAWENWPDETGAPADLFEP